MIKRKLFSVELTILALAAALSFNACGAIEEESGFTPMTAVVANNDDTLGLVGTEVPSSNEGVATATLEGGGLVVVITSQGEGSATIRVVKDADTSAAEIPVAVSADGAIRVGTITKGGAVDFRPQTKSVANDNATLGLVGVKVSSDNKETATAVIDGGNIVITPVSVGSATIRVVKDADTIDAEIPITVNPSGTITVGTISRGDIPITRIGGSVDVSVAGKNPKVSVAVRIQDEPGQYSVEVDENGNWLWKTAAFTEEKEVFFVLDLTFEDGSLWSYWDWGGKDAHVYTQEDRTDITLPSLSVSNLITLSGTVSAEINGEWNAANKTLSVRFSDGLDCTAISAPLASLNGGSWSIVAPALVEEREIKFSVRYETGNPWSAGQKQFLSPTNVYNEDVSGIELGLQRFVVLRGNTPVTVNGTPVLTAELDLSDGYGSGENGWTGGVGIAANGDWAIPMPVNVNLNINIYYRLANYIERVKPTNGSVSINTGYYAKTIDLIDISSAVTY
jgi:hypothetical protein